MPGHGLPEEGGTREPDDPHQARKGRKGKGPARNADKSKQPTPGVSPRPVTTKVPGGTREVTVQEWIQAHTARIAEQTGSAVVLTGGNNPMVAADGEIQCVILYATAEGVNVVGVGVGRATVLGMLAMAMDVEPKDYRQPTDPDAE